MENLMMKNSTIHYATISHMTLYSKGEKHDEILWILQWKTGRNRPVWN